MKHKHEQDCITRSNNTPFDAEIFSRRMCTVLVSKYAGTNVGCICCEIQTKRSVLAIHCMFAFHGKVIGPSFVACHGCILFRSLHNAEHGSIEKLGLL